MTKKTLPVRGDISFEDLKKINNHDAEYWIARDLQPLLGYSQWRRFEDAIKRSIISCQQSGNEPNYHFAGAGKPIKRIGGAMSENIPAAEHINVVEKRIKNTPPLMELEEKDAKGLTGKVDE